MLSVLGGLAVASSRSSSLISPSCCTDRYSVTLEVRIELLIGISR